MDLFTLKQQITEAAELSALAITRQLYPAMDEVKYKEAVKIAGSEQWLKYHIERGNIVLAHLLQSYGYSRDEKG